MATAKKKGKLVIAILDRGWVFVARVSETPSAISLRYESFER